MRKENFLAAMLKYKKLVPYNSPDFSDDFVLDFWFKALKEYEADRLGRAFERLCMKGKFPSINDIKDELGEEELSDDAIAREVADRIYDAISRFGGNNYKSAVEHIGEIGEVVVGGGHGWRSICDSTTPNNAGMLKAQWRESAKSAMERARKGISGPPKLPSLNLAVKSLLDKQDENVVSLNHATQESRDIVVRQET